MSTVERLGTSVLESDFIKKLKKNPWPKHLSQWLHFVFSPKVNRKQTACVTQVPAGSREWMAAVSDKTIINGFACLVSFSESGREWNGQQLSFKLLFCPVINLSYSFWLLSDSGAETTLNQARAGVNVEGQPRYAVALVTWAEHQR